MQTSIKDQETRDGKSMTTGTSLTGLRNVRRQRWSHGKVSNETEGFLVEDYNMVDKTSTISMSPHPVSVPVTSSSSTTLCDKQGTDEDQCQDDS